MARVLIGAVVGGLFLFIWGFVSWVILPWHNSTLPPIPNEAAFIAAIEAQEITEHKMYHFPAMADMNDDEAWAAYIEKHKAGPAGFIVIDPNPGEPMPPASMIGGGVIAFLTALIISYALWLTNIGPAAGRWLFVYSFGLVLMLQQDAMNWNWMLNPDDFTKIMMADHAVTFAGLGVLLAAIVKPKRKAEPAGDEV